MKKLLTFILIISTASAFGAENYEVILEFDKAKDFRKKEIMCPESFRSNYKDGGKDNKDFYCNGRKGKAQADAICVPPGLRSILFRGKDGFLWTKNSEPFAIIPKPGSSMKCDSRPDEVNGLSPAPQTCTVNGETDDPPMQYSIVTASCEFDPRIIITDEQDPLGISG